MASSHPGPADLPIVRVDGPGADGRSLSALLKDFAVAAKCSFTSRFFMLLQNMRPVAGAKFGSSTLVLDDVVWPT